MEKPEPNCGGWEDKKKTLLVAGVDVHCFAKFESAVGNLYNFLSERRGSNSSKF